MLLSEFPEKAGIVCVKAKKDGNIAGSVRVYTHVCKDQMR